MLQELLDPYRGREDIKLDELVSLAAEIIPKVTGPQLRQRVSEIPDVRTVRYYIQQGLVDRPLGSEGPAALYGFRHLLQLVAIKVLQGHFLPIRAIKEALGKVETAELENRLDEWLASPRPELSSPEYWASWVPLRALGAVEDGPESTSPTRSLQQSIVAGKPGESVPSSARNYLESLAGRKRREVTREGTREGKRELKREAMEEQRERDEHFSLADRPACGVDIDEIQADIKSTLGASIVETGVTEPVSKGDVLGQEADASWQRIVLHPGIELHVREGTRIPASPSFLSALASRLRVMLEKMGKKKDEGDR